MAPFCIAAISKGELLFGLTRRPAAKRLHVAVRQFLRRVDVLPWNSSTAEHYGIVRADMEKRGRILASLDLLIATHALSVDAVLVTNDKAFSQMVGLHVEDWTV